MAWSRAVGRFMPATEFMDQAAAFADVVRAAPRAPGFDEILMPGEPEWRARTRRIAEGIPIPAETHRAILDLAAELGVSVR